MLAPWEKNYDQPRQHIKKQRHYFTNKDLSSQNYSFSTRHVWMWQLDYKESWALKNWCFWTVVLEKTLESPLDSKEIQPVHPKGNESWIVIGRTDVEAGTPILWRPDAKSWLIWKDSDAGKIEGRKMEGGEGDNKGWDGWMTSPTLCIWVWASSGTGTPGMLQSMGLHESRSSSKSVTQKSKSRKQTSFVFHHCWRSSTKYKEANWRWLAPGQGFPCSSTGKESACSAGDPSLIPGSGRSSGEGIGYPL